MIGRTAPAANVFDAWRDDKNVRPLPRTLAQAFPHERACALERPRHYDVTRASHRAVLAVCAVGLAGFAIWVLHIVAGA